MNLNSYKCCTKGDKEPKRVETLSTLLRLVSEESKLKLLCILRRGEHCVCEIMEHLKLSQSLISHHLQDLKLADIVTHEKRGLRVYYTLTPQGRLIADTLLNIFGKEKSI